MKMSTYDRIMVALSCPETFTTIAENASFQQNQMIEHANRRDHLGELMNKHKLQCPECETVQVQLVEYINVYPAKWKCRKCKHNFEWEVEV